MIQTMCALMYVNLNICIFEFNIFSDFFSIQDLTILQRKKTARYKAEKMKLKEQKKKKIIN